MYNPFSLSEKVIFISGASSGIGKATAIECSKLGAKLIISGRNKGRLKETFDALSDTGHFMIQSDFTETASIDLLVEKLPVVDGLVHCAGLTNNIPFSFIKEKHFKEIMQINFFAPAMISQKMLRQKKISKNASIVFVSSISGINVSFPSGALYSSTKGAINGLLKGMALDLAGKGIRVNSVNPGMIETAIYKNSPIAPVQLEEDRKKYPLKRYGKPEEVAFGIIYLLSDASSWVTGTNLLIDGGFTLQ